MTLRAAQWPPGGQYPWGGTEALEGIHWSSRLGTPLQSPDTPKATSLPQHVS